MSAYVVIWNLFGSSPAIVVAWNWLPAPVTGCCMPKLDQIELNKAGSNCTWLCSSLQHSTIYAITMSAGFNVVINCWRIDLQYICSNLCINDHGGPGLGGWPLIFKFVCINTCAWSGLAFVLRTRIYNIAEDLFAQMVVVNPF